MGLPIHRSHSMRAIAVFVAAYCVLASGRALVPGLCATLADAKAGEAMACHVPKTPCCEHGGAGAPIAITHPTHPCAFCALVHHGVLLDSAPAVHRQQISAPRFLVAHDAYAPDPAAFGAGTRRGPPLS